MSASKFKGRANPPQKGIATVPVSGSVTGILSVVFDLPYSIAPKVTGLVVAGTNAWTASVPSGLSATGMDIGVRRIDGGGATSTSISVHWSVEV